MIAVGFRNQITRTGLNKSTGFAWDIREGLFKIAVLSTGIDGQARCAELGIVKIAQHIIDPAGDAAGADVAAFEGSRR